MINGKGDVIYWVAHCWNDWCDVFRSTTDIVYTKPTEGIHCPYCGWLALLGSGIAKHCIPYRFRGDVDNIEHYNNLS